MRLARRPLMSMARAGSLAMAAGALAAAAVLPVAAAGASPTTASRLASQASALQTQLVSTAHQLHALAAGTLEASARLTAANAAIQNEQATLSQLRTDLSQATATLRTVAIQAYMSDSGSDSALAIFSSSPTEASAMREYTAVASGTESGAIDTFRRARTIVTQQQAVMRSEQAAATAAYDMLGRQYTALQKSILHEQAMLAAVQQQQQVLAQQQAFARQQALVALRQQQAAAQAARQGAPLAVDVGSLVPTGSSMAQDLARLRECESGGDYQADTGNGYYGAYQFALSTWQGLGYSGLPSAASPATQDQAAMRLEQFAGWGQWPVCSAMLGLS